jgi:hypothetical protein
LARFREVERRALFRAERRPPFLAALALLADLRPPFLALFLLARLADLLAAFLRALLLGVGLTLGDGSSESPYDDGVEAGVGEGVLSMGSGSIHPEPDQPISI